MALPPQLPPHVRGALDAIRAAERVPQGAAYEELLGELADPVDWAAAAWDELVALLTDRNNRTRAIAAQLLCHLAKSDTEGRMPATLDAIVAVTHDEKFVTARHSLQALWHIGLVPALRPLLLDRIGRRYDLAAAEKNGTLVRYDLLEGLAKLHTATGDATVEALARELIARETDEKYRRKYKTLWRPG